MMSTMYGLLGLYYELFQRSLNQNNFNLQKARILSVQRSWNFFQCSVNKIPARAFGTTLKLSEKAIAFDLLATSEKDPIGFYSNSNRKRFNPYNVLRVCIHGHLLKNASLFAPD